MRFAKRTDDNHESVVRALRLILAKDGSVHDLSGAGRGTPDIMVGYQAATSYSRSRTAPSRRAEGNLRRHNNDSIAAGADRSTRSRPLPR